VLGESDGDIEMGHGTRTCRAEVVKGLVRPYLSIEGFDRSRHGGNVV